MTKLLHRLGQALRIAARALGKIATFGLTACQGCAVVLFLLLYGGFKFTHITVNYTRDIVRMVEWLLLAALFYWGAMQLPIAGHYAPLQTLLWKLGHVTLGSFIGYWIDRIAFRDRIECSTPPLIKIRRAVMMATATVTLGMGL